MAVSRSQSGTGVFKPTFVAALVVTAITALGFGSCALADVEACATCAGAPTAGASEAGLPAQTKNDCSSAQFAGGPEAATAPFSPATSAPATNVK